MTASKKTENIFSIKRRSWGARGGHYSAKFLEIVQVGGAMDDCCLTGGNQRITGQRDGRGGGGEF